MKRSSNMSKWLLMCLIGIMVCTMCFTLCCCKKKTNNADKDSIVVGIQQALDGLDPHTAESAGTREVLYNVFDGLIKVGADGNIEKALASDYSISEDGKIYTFTLRQNVKFHDGSILTAEDVKYSIERNAGLLATGGEALDSAFANITSVNIKDANTVELVLATSDTEFISYLNEPVIKNGAAGKKSATGPVGTGPYKITDYVPGEKLELVRFDEYWNEEGKAHIKNVTFKVVTASTAIIEMRAGSIDIFPYITEDQATELSAANFEILSGNTNLVQALYLNNKNNKFADIRVRQALNYAVNKQEILDMVAGGKGTILGSALFEGFGKYYKDLSGKYEYNTEKAKELLKEALGDEKLSFVVRVPSNYEVHMNTALVIQEQLKKVGVEMTIDAIDWSTWLDEVYSQKKYEATIVGIDAKLAPKDMMRRYATIGSGNLTGYTNAIYDALYYKAIETTSDDEKVTLYHQMQELLADEAVSVFIQDNAQLVAINKNLGGYTFYPIYVQDMASVYFK